MFLDSTVQERNQTEPEALCGQKHGAQGRTGKGRGPQPKE